MFTPLYLLRQQDGAAAQVAPVEVRAHGAGQGGNVGVCRGAWRVIDW